jgi:hypothetical protein
VLSLLRSLALSLSLECPRAIESNRCPIGIQQASILQLSRPPLITGNTHTFVIISPRHPSGTKRADAYHRRSSAYHLRHHPRHASTRSHVERSGPRPHAKTAINTSYLRGNRPPISSDSIEMRTHKTQRRQAAQVPVTIPPLSEGRQHDI